jgi:hypothetical protein
MRLECPRSLQGMVCMVAFLLVPCRQELLKLRMTVHELPTSPSSHVQRLHSTCGLLWFEVPDPQLGRSALLLRLLIPM